MRVLFTCACGQNSEKLFHDIKKDLGKKVLLFGCDIKKKFGKTNLHRFYKVSLKNNNNFLKQILKICKDNQINLIVAWADKEIEILSKNKNKFKKIKTKILLNNYKLIKIFNDKFKTFQLLKKMNIPLPRYKLLTKNLNIKQSLMNFGYPKKSVIIKSRYGIGGRGTYLLMGKDYKKYSWFGNFGREKKFFRINNKILSQIVQKNKSILMEAMNKPAYDVDILKTKNDFLTSIRKRNNPAGIPYRGSKVISNKKILRISKKIVEKLRLKYILDFDFMTRMNGNTPTILEINPRPSGSIVDSHYKGKKILTKMLRAFMKN